VRYVTGDLIETEFPPADCVLLIDALHYWSAEKQICIIARCAACLRRGGKLIFREAMRSGSAGHRAVDGAERAAVWLGHNPRGDGLCFQPRDFYLQEFVRHGLEVQREPTGWGRGSNTVMILSWH
jgi:SAM-dependent methyltransferase